MLIGRRSFLRGLIAAPIVITTPGLLMPVRPLRSALPDLPEGWVWYHTDLLKPPTDSFKTIIQMRYYESELIRRITGVDHADFS